MAELIAVAYPDKNTARDVMQTLSRLQTEHVVELADVAVVTKEQDGKVRLVQGRDLVAMGALGGALWGGLIGLLFFAPLLGMLVGMAGGALGGKFSDYGIDDRFMKDLGAQFQPGGAAVFVLNLLVLVLKVGLGRGQPGFADPSFFVGGMAYPSGHTANIVLVYGLAVYLLGRYLRVSRRTYAIGWVLPRL